MFSCGHACRGELTKLQQQLYAYAHFSVINPWNVWRMLSAKNKTHKQIIGRQRSALIYCMWVHFGLLQDLLKNWKLF